MSGGVSALAAEFIGTLILVFFAVGTAVFAGIRAGVVGIALEFGFVLIALVYTIGTISGCHVSPAVTLGMVLSGRVKARCGALYAVMQFAGGIVGALSLYWVSRGCRVPYVLIWADPSSAMPSARTGTARTLT